MPYLTPSAPSTTVRRALLIPDTYLPIVNGAIGELIQAHNWEKFGAQTIDQAVQAMSDLLDAYYVSIVTDDINGRTADPLLWLPSGSVGAWQFSSLSTIDQGGFWTFGNGNQNNSVDLNVWLNAGTWGIHVEHRKANSLGIITFKLNGASVATLDLYQNATVSNIVSSTLGFTVAQAGYKTLSLVMATKNPSSSAYQCQLQRIALRQAP